MLTGPSKQLLAAISAFVDFLRHEKHYSAHTVSNYRRDLNGLMGFLVTHEIGSWEEVTPQHIRQYTSQRHRQGLNGRSLQRQLSAVRSLYKYLQRHQLVSHNPAQDIPIPKSDKRLPKTLDIESVEQLLAIKGGEPLILRDLAIMELLYSSGLRLAEIVGLSVDDLDQHMHLVRVLGKGAKQRDVPVGQKALVALSRWLAVRHEMANADENALFVSRRGTRLSPRTLQQRLSMWAKKQGLDQHVHPHRLRHAFASHMLESSGDLRAVQELLGHADISTTQVYTHLDFQHLAKVYDDAHPRARKNKKPG